MRWLSLMVKPLFVEQADMGSSPIAIALYYYLYIIEK